MLTIQLGKTDTLLNSITNSATTATLTSGNFTADKIAILAIDYDVPASREIVLCTVSGTGITNMVRGLEGTTGVAHSANAKVAMVFTPTHYAQLADSLTTGWMNGRYTWVYVSAASFKIVGVDLTTTFTAGTRVRLKQGGAYKYFYVVSSTFSTDTTVTVTGGADYSLANASITDNYFSKTSQADGFPEWMNWTPGFFTGFSANPSGGIYRFRMMGKLCQIIFAMPNSGTSNATNFRIGLPFTALGTASYIPVAALAQATDNSAESSTPDRIFIDPSDPTSLRFSKNNSQTGWTNSGGKAASGEFFFEIA